MVLLIALSGMLVLQAQDQASTQAQTPLTDTVLQEVRTAYSAKKQPVVVFDIDGTLMDNRPRILTILHEFADNELKDVRPEEAEIIKGIALENVRYQVADTLKEAGITEEAVINNAVIFWTERFYTSPYLKYDVPTPGSVQFVRSLYSSGARIVYVTGRDQPRQLVGTVESLQRNGFPIGIQSSELIMKPTMQTQDAIFKRQITSYLRHYGEVVAAFDNEPLNVNVYRRSFPLAKIVLFDAPHSPNPPKLVENIEHLPGF